jgi:hypothetical protein
MEETQILNQEIEPARLEKIKRVVEINITNAPLVQKLGEAPKTEKEIQFEEDLIKERLIPNPFVKETVEPMRPILLSDFRKTKVIVADRTISITCQNENSVFRIFGAIASQNDMSLVSTFDQEYPISKDAVEKRVDFSMQNGTLTEDSLFLMGSQDPKHQVKSFTVKIDKPYATIPTKPDDKKKYVHEIKEQLARAHVFLWKQLSYTQLHLGVKISITQSMISLILKSINYQLHYGKVFPTSVT